MDLWHSNAIRWRFSCWQRKKLATCNSGLGVVPKNTKKTSQCLERSNINYNNYNKNKNNKDNNNKDNNNNNKGNNNNNNKCNINNNTNNNSNNNCDNNSNNKCNNNKNNNNNEKTTTNIGLNRPHASVMHIGVDEIDSAGIPGISNADWIVTGQFKSIIRSGSRSSDILLLNFT